MKRGDIVTVAASGDYGKPRPAIIVQTDFLNDTHASVLVCLVSSTTISAPLFRLDIEANSESGLTKASQIMIDKIVAIKREKIGNKIGELSSSQKILLDRNLAFVLGLAK